MQRKAYNILSGSYGTFYVNNELVFEVEECTADVEIQREDVQFGLSVDSKMVGASGSGSFSVKQVHSNGLKMMQEIIKKGKDVRAVIAIRVEDPDAIDGQVEHVTIPNVWFNKYTLAGFKRGETIKKQYEFGFTPTDTLLNEVIHG